MKKKKTKGVNDGTKKDPNEQPTRTLTEQQ